MAVVNVNTVKTTLELLGRKSQTTGYLSATKFNTAADFAQREEYLFQRPRFESGEVSADDFSIAKKEVTVTLNSSGVFPKPSDYLFYDVGRVYSYGRDLDGNAKQQVKPLRFLSSAEFAEKKSNRFEAPTKIRPIAVELADSFQVYPPNPFRVELAYLAAPSAPVWAYTIVGGRQVYNSVGSTQFSLPVQLTNNIVWRMARYLGIEVMQPDLIQAGTSLINSGEKE